MSSEIDWRQLASIWNGPQGKALKDYLDTQFNNAVSEITAKSKGFDGIVKMLEARGSLSIVERIIDDMEKAEGIAKHNEGSFIAKVLK